MPMATASSQNNKNTNHLMKLQATSGHANDQRFPVDTPSCRPRSLEVAYHAPVLFVYERQSPESRLVELLPYHPKAYELAWNLLEASPSKVSRTQNTTIDALSIDRP